MSHIAVLVFALLIGVVAGLRALTPPAVVRMPLPCASDHWFSRRHTTLCVAGSKATMWAPKTGLPFLVTRPDRLPSRANPGPG